jgi:hypothetical protein
VKLGNKTQRTPKKEAQKISQQKSRIKVKKL